MKIARYHKQRGDHVEWYNGISHYDKVYVAEVFTFTPDYAYYINSDEVEKGGTGYDLHKELPQEIDRLQPDYSIYPQINLKTAYGFLTRGCPNRCRWCIVPQKEGNIHPYMDVDEIAIDGKLVEDYIKDLKKQLDFTEVRKFAKAILDDKEIDSLTEEKEDWQ